MQTLSLQVQGMSCAGCAAAMEKAIRALPGVVNCDVNFGAEQATVKYNPKATNLEKIQWAVVEAGYAASPLPEMGSFEDDTSATARLEENLDLTRFVVVSGGISVLLVMGSLPAMTGLDLPWIPAWFHNPWVQLVLTAPVQFWCGQSFYQRAWKALKRHAADMNTLIALGTSAAYFYSLFATVNPSFFRAQGLAPDVYYETAAIVRSNVSSHP